MHSVKFLAAYVFIDPHKISPATTCTIYLKYHLLFPLDIFAPAAKPNTWENTFSTINIGSH